MSIFVPVGQVSKTQRRRKDAHLFGSSGNIPTVLFTTHGKVYDVKILNQAAVESGTIYVMDRGHLDFRRLYRIRQSMGFFVTRAKSHSELWDISVMK
jgi:hypothetical protein